MKLNLFEKFLIGVYSIRIGEKYVGFNKLAPFMTLMMALAGFCQQSIYDIPVLFWIGIIGIVIGFFAFFYLDIFPSRKPKTKEDEEKFYTVINDKKA